MEQVTWDHVQGVSQQVHKLHKHPRSPCIVSRGYESPPPPLQRTATPWTRQRLTEDALETVSALAGDILKTGRRPSEDWPDQCYAVRLLWYSFSLASARVVNELVPWEEGLAGIELWEKKALGKTWKTTTSPIILSS